MDKISNKIQSLKEVNKNLPLIVFDVAILNEQILLTMNREQMDDGLRGDGSEINRVDRDYKGYHPFTISIKESKGQVTSHITLEDTGDYKRGLKLNFDYANGWFEFWSSDEKTQKLVSMYGIDIFGLTEPNLQRVIENFRPQIINIIKERVIYA